MQESKRNSVVGIICMVEMKLAATFNVVQHLVNIIVQNAVNYLAKSILNILIQI